MEFVTSPSKANAVLALGADQIVDRNDDLTRVLGKGSVDVVTDLVAGPPWPRLLEVLKPFGRYAVAGAIGGSMVELDVRRLYLKELSLFVGTVLGGTVFSSLVRRIEAGEIKPLVAQTITLNTIREAQTQFETKTHIGTLVIKADSAH
jgi:NADPH:quinone reductase-like Zn-dependent oxidoreductase